MFSDCTIEVGSGVVVTSPIELDEITVQPGEHARVHEVDEARGLIWFKLDRYHWSLARDRNCFVMPSWLADETLSLLERTPLNVLVAGLARSHPVSG